MLPSRKPEGVHDIQDIGHKPPDPGPGSMRQHGLMEALGVAAHQYRSEVVIAHSDPGVRSLLAAVLKKDGYGVFRVADGIELLEWLADRLLEDETLGMPDIIVAEIDLPGRRGIDILADLRGSGWSTPFIFTAGPEDHAMVVNAERLGPVAVFEAPFEIDDFRTSAYCLASPDKQLPFWEPAA